MIYFRLSCIVKSLGIHGENLIRFEIPELVSVELRPLADAEISKHYTKGDLLCTAVLQKKPTRKIGLWLANPEEPQSSGFSDFANEARHDLAHAAVRAVKFWRWRSGYRGDQNPIKFFKPLEWSVDGHNWTPLPNSLRLNATFGIPFAQVTDEIVESVLSLSGDNAQEPLAQELFQEAWSQCDVKPRSSLVMGIAAAETGVKHLMSTLVPEARWLVEETQSPPFVRMLTEYPPKLPAGLRINGKVLPPPQWLIEIIKKGVGLRNDIVHGHQIQLKSDSLREVLDAIHALLYLCDLYSGHKWAWQWLSSRMQSSLANEA